MRTYDEIYSDIIADTGDRFTIRKLIDVFVTESDWIGTHQQTLKCASLSLEITGIRIGSCSSCMLDGIKNLVRWINKHEETILAARKPIKKTK
jgi:hypothetical protein